MMKFFDCELYISLSLIHGRHIISFFSGTTRFENQSLFLEHQNWSQDDELKFSTQKGKYIILKEFLVFEAGGATEERYNAATMNKAQADVKLTIKKFHHIHTFLVNKCWSVFGGVLGYLYYINKKSIKIRLNDTNQSTRIWTLIINIYLQSLLLRIIWKSLNSIFQNRIWN